MFLNNLLDYERFCVIVDEGATQVKYHAIEIS